MPCFVSIAFNNSFSPRKRAISSSYFFLSSAAEFVAVVSALPFDVLFECEKEREREGNEERQRGGGDRKWRREQFRLIISIETTVND